MPAPGAQVTSGRRRRGELRPADDHAVLVGVDRVELCDVRRPELVGADLAVLVGVELLEELRRRFVGRSTWPSPRLEFRQAELAVLVGVELLELGLRALARAAPGALQLALVCARLDLGLASSLPSWLASIAAKAASSCDETAARRDGLGAALAAAEAGASRGRSSRGARTGAQHESISRVASSARRCASAGRMPQVTMLARSEAGKPRSR